jgi:hypothetical protein
MGEAEPACVASPASGQPMRVKRVRGGNYISGVGAANAARQAPALLNSCARRNRSRLLLRCIRIAARASSAS